MDLRSFICTVLAVRIVGTVSRTCRDISRRSRTQSRSRSEFIFDKELIDELVIDKDLIDELVIDKELIDELIFDKELIDELVSDKELIDELIVDWTSTRTNKGASSARSSYAPWHREGVAHVALARI